MRENLLGMQKKVNVSKENSAPCVQASPTSFFKTGVIHNLSIPIDNSSGTPTRAIGPNWVNRAHWPTKENSKQKYAMFAFFPEHGEIVRNGAKWGQEFLCCPTNPDLVDILGDTHFDFDNLYF